MTSEDMRKDWDERARSNAMYYIATNYDPSFNEPQTFYGDGQTEAETLLKPVLDRLSFDPKGKRIVDIGCGIGRMFVGFDRLGFDEIWGVDVSKEMVEVGASLCPVEGARFRLGDGESLAEFGDGSVDFCFSYIVFQHITDESILWTYMREVSRVLRPGGVFMLQFRGSHKLRSRIAKFIPGALLLLGQEACRNISIQGLRGRRRFVGSHRTWTGAAVWPNAVRQRSEDLGLANIAIEPDELRARNTGFWVSGEKPRVSLNGTGVTHRSDQPHAIGPELSL